MLVDIYLLIIIYIYILVGSLNVIFILFTTRWIDFITQVVTFNLKISFYCDETHCDGSINKFVNMLKIIMT